MCMFRTILADKPRTRARRVGQAIAQLTKPSPAA